MDENQIFEAAKAGAERMKAFEQREKIANERNRNEMTVLLDLVNSVLKKYSIADTVSNQHIKFYSDYIGNISDLKNKKLSELIFNKYFPPPSLKTYYHYTSLAAAESIIVNKTLRLSNLLKRFNDGEYRTFYDDHGMDGYMVGGTVLGVDTGERAIMKDIYFLSLTSLAFDFAGETKWLNFGDHGHGVRLEFEITPKHDDFREVYYSLYQNENCIPLLKELFAEIKAAYGIPFNFSYSSKIGAFYIKGPFENEKEFRFLVKTTADNYKASHIQPVITDEDNQIAYIELPFSSEFADFKLISIQPGYNCSENDIKCINELVMNHDSSIQVYTKGVEYIVF